MVEAQFLVGRASVVLHIVGLICRLHGKKVLFLDATNQSVNLDQHCRASQKSKKHDLGFHQAVYGGIFDQSDGSPENSKNKC